MKPLFIFLFLSFSMLINAQIQLCNTSGKIFNLLSYDIQKEQVECTCVDNSDMSLSKKEIVYIKTSQDQVITFLSGKKKLVLKEKNIDPTDLATLGRIDAFRFYRTQNEPIITDKQYLQSYNEQVNKIRTGHTVSAILGGVAFAVGLTTLIVTMSAL